MELRLIPPIMITIILTLITTIAIDLGIIYAPYAPYESNDIDIGKERWAGVVTTLLCGFGLIVYAIWSRFNNFNSNIWVAIMIWGGIILFFGPGVSASKTKTIWPRQKRWRIIPFIILGIFVGILYWATDGFAGWG